MTEDYDDIDRLIDTDPIALGQRCRDAETLLAKVRELAERFQPNGFGTVDAEYGEIASLLDLLIQGTAS